MLLALLLVTLLINLMSLRKDVRAEVAASEQLVQALLSAGQIAPGLAPEVAAARLAAILDTSRLRHLSIRPADAVLPPARSSMSSRLATLLGIVPAGDTGQLVQLGSQRVRIAPDPSSEMEERFGDTVRLSFTLLFFSGATLLVAWWAAHRALAPVRELEAGLQRLARGDADAALPRFALREFRRVAGAIDALAAALSQARDAQRQLSRRLIQVQEDERRTLARDLHDEMGQTLTAISVTATYLQRNAQQLEASQIIDCAQDLRRDVRTSGAQLRAMLMQLRPHGLDGPGLTSALRELVSSWQQRESGIAFGLVLPAPLPLLADEAGVALYRVVQEALTNVVRHSAATQCTVTITVQDAQLLLQVDDDGDGLAPEVPRGGGLLGIAERLRMVGGSLRIVPNAPQGLRLQIHLPLPEPHLQETP
ncbi:two-component sensor histidine kinase-like protein [Oxalobacteraceae bacterium IMCC9480]|nr:two-component sensor histidine kinase-like protein [Oxalobacteraceae bacterium IMCC9480]